MYLLDTNVASELRRVEAGKGDTNVAVWAASVTPSDVYLTVITCMEIEQGILKVDRYDAAQSRHLRAWFARILSDLSPRILGLDLRSALRCAALHIPDPMPERDALIAAIALEHDLTLVTRNTADFERSGVRLLNPWQSI